uniref:Uncharacterized protein n=1 Tax=Caenorhabditis japonica TaxID=281687 RepID=A0A8R1J1E7_CAEJA
METQRRDKWRPDISHRAFFKNRTTCDESCGLENANSSRVFAGRPITSEMIKAKMCQYGRANPCRFLRYDVIRMPLILSYILATSPNPLSSSTEKACSQSFLYSIYCLIHNQL